MKECVLLVDDDKGVRRMLMETLADDDRYDVVLASDGEEALAVASERHPGLVLLDVRMPKLDGFEVCRRLKGDRATRHAKVVMLTAIATDEARKTGREVGADD